MNARNLFWAATRCITAKDFNMIMERMKSIDEAVYKRLNNILSKHWSKHAFDDTIKINYVTNNMAESFNSKLN